jgi:tRNA_anti-like
MMKKILIVLIVLAIGAWYAYHEYNRRNKDLKDSAADVNTNAVALIQAFQKDTAGANHQYVNKVIAVSGPVKKIDADGNPVVIFLGNKGEMSSVKCSMDSSHVTDYKAIKDGDVVTIKGKCTGGVTDDLFGTDVTLNFCVVQNKP